MKIGVVGGGIVGLATARELAVRLPDAQITVFEKERRLGSHQTGHNSGVVHAGLYYRPGTLKAELCARGRSLLTEYAAEHSLPFRACGKLVVAIHPTEMGRFDALEATARENQVPGLTRLDRSGINDLEPAAHGIAALHSPATAITDFGAVAEAYAADLRACGGVVRLNSAVTALRTSASGVTLETKRRAGEEGIPERFDRVVVCGGLQADRLARLAGGSADPRVVPFRGEYLRVIAPKQELVRGLIYPVPDPRYPFLGVHFTRRVDGSLDVGPNAVLGRAREGYGRRSVHPRDLWDIAAWPGTWRMARAHWRTGLEELRGSLSVDAYLETARRYVPAIGVTDVVRGPTGIRAQVVARDGSLVDDFVIHQEDGVTVVRNAPSPAATSSLAIASYVADRMQSA